MAASSGVTQGTQINLYYNATAAADHAAATIDSFVAVAGNIVPNVTDIGASEATFNVIEYNAFGAANTNKLVGQYNAGDFTFDVAYDDNDANHMSFRNYGLDSSESRPDDKNTFVIGIQTGTNDETYVAMDGWITGASMATAVDGVSTLSVTVTLEERPTFVASART